MFTFCKVVNVFVKTVIGLKEGKCATHSNHKTGQATVSVCFNSESYVLPKICLKFE